MQGKLTWTARLLTILLLTGAVLPTGPLAQSEAAADSLVDISAGPTALPDAAMADTVRTNLWLVEALMAEVVASTVQVLPPVPAAVRLVARGNQPSDDLFQSALFRVLNGLGYHLFLEADDPTHEGAVDVVFTYKVVAVDLEYPDVGRTLGIWRRWIQRELGVAVQVEISRADSGQLLLSERLERRFGDRVAAGDFTVVDSATYDFTHAETEESGLQRRMEEIVVLSTLAGLVAVYFANTGN